MLKKSIRLTMRAVDRWVRAAFFELFLALGFSRLGGESHPTHLPLTQAVGRQLLHYSGEYVHTITMETGKYSRK
jgi:hypothetical protein